MNNISIANETIKITAEGAELVKNAIRSSERMCDITVTTEDTFAAAKRFERPYVMNFANARTS